MISKNVESIVGALILSVVCLFGYNLYNNKTDKIGYETYKICARFDNIAGISVGSEVKICGVNIGRVVNVKLGEDCRTAMVELIVQKSLKIPDDSSASISSVDLFGSKHIAISYGNSDNDMKEGDEIENTQGSITIEKLIGKMITTSN